MAQAQTEVPRYRLLTPHFIEPDYLKADVVIEYEGPPNEGMEPLNKAAEDRLAKYFESHPKATINPVDDLPRTFASVVPEVKPEAGVKKVGGPS